MKFDLMYRRVERAPGKAIIESGSKGKENETGNLLERKVSSENWTTAFILILEYLYIL